MGLFVCSAGGSCGRSRERIKEEVWGERMAGDGSYRAFNEKGNGWRNIFIECFVPLLAPAQ